MAWYTYHLARGLIKAGHEVHLSAQKDSPLAEWATKEGIPGSFHSNFRSANPFDLFLSLQELSRTIKVFKPEILNPHCPPGHSLLALQNHGRLPLVRTVADPRAPKKHFVNRFLHERLTDGMVYSTDTSLVRYENAFNFKSKLEQVVHPGLDLRLFPEPKNESWRHKLNVPDGALFAAIIARMSPEKGQELLIDALSLLSDSLRQSIVVYLTGDDSKERTAAELANYAKLKGVFGSLRFGGRLADVKPLLNEIDLGIITSTRSEAVCRIALEYMVYSKPILSTDVNILPEVVRSGVNGWCVPSTSAAALAKVLELAISERSGLTLLGKQGLALLQSEFTLDTMTSATLEFFESVIRVHGQSH